MVATKDIQMGAIADICKKTNEAGKVPLIIDSGEDGNVTTFFTYSANVCSVGKFVIQNAMGGSNDIGDEMRRSYVGACKYGKTLIYDIGQNFSTKWKEWCSTADQKFNPNVVFDLKKCKEREHFEKMVKPDEDVDNMGNKMVYPSDNFWLGVTIMSGPEQERIDEVLADAKAFLPDFETKFEVFIVKY